MEPGEEEHTPIGTKPPVTPDTPKPNNPDNNMSAETKQIIEKIDEVKTGIEKTTEVLQGAIELVATGAQGVDENEIKKLFNPDTEKPKGTMGDHPPGGAMDHPPGNGGMPIKKEENPAGAAGENKQLLETIKTMENKLKLNDETLKKIVQKDIDAALVADNKLRSEQALAIVKGKLAYHEIENEKVQEEFTKIMELKDSRDPEKLADLKYLADMYSDKSIEINEIPSGAAGEKIMVSGTGTGKGDLDDFLENLE